MSDISKAILAITASITVSLACDWQPTLSIDKDKTLSFDVNPSVSGVYVIEGSTNLIDWEPISEVHMDLEYSYPDLQCCTNSYVWHWQQLGQRVAIWNAGFRTDGRRVTGLKLPQREALVVRVRFNEKGKQ